MNQPNRWQLKQYIIWLFTALYLPMDLPLQASQTAPQSSAIEERKTEEESVRVAPRNLIMIFDKGTDNGNLMLTDMTVAIIQQCSCILVNEAFWQLFNTKKFTEAFVIRDAKEKNRLEETFTDQTIADIFFDAHAWDIFRIEQQQGIAFYFLVPQKYRESLRQPLGINEEALATLKQTATNVQASKEDEKTHATQPAPKQLNPDDFSTNDHISNVLSLILTPKDAAPQYCWSVYCGGHGGATIEETPKFIEECQSAKKEYLLIVPFVEKHKRIVELYTQLEKALRVSGISTTLVLTMPWFYADRVRHGKISKEAQKLTTSILDLIAQTLLTQHPNQTVTEQEKATFIKQLENAIIKKNKYQDTLKRLKPLEGLITGVSVSAFKHIIDFFNTKVRTNFFIYKTCHGGGKHLITPFDDQTCNLNFPVVSCALTDESITGIPGIINTPEADSSLYPFSLSLHTLNTTLADTDIFCSYVNFERFFNKLELLAQGKLQFKESFPQKHISPKKMTPEGTENLPMLHMFDQKAAETKAPTISIPLLCNDVCQFLTPLEPDKIMYPQNIPNIRWPFLGWFKVVNHPDFVTITRTKIIAKNIDTLRTNDDINRFFDLTKSHIALLQTNNIVIPIRINKDTRLVPLFNTIPLQPRQETNIATFFTQQPYPQRIYFNMITSRDGFFELLNRVLFRSQKEKSQSHFQNTIFLIDKLSSSNDTVTSSFLEKEQQELLINEKPLVIDHVILCVNAQNPFNLNKTNVMLFRLNNHHYYLSKKKDTYTLKRDDKLAANYLATYRQLRNSIADDRLDPYRSTFQTIEDGLEKLPEYPTNELQTNAAETIDESFATLPAIYKRQALELFTQKDFANPIWDRLGSNIKTLIQQEYTHLLHNLFTQHTPASLDRFIALVIKTYPQLSLNNEQLQTLLNLTTRLIKAGSNITKTYAARLFYCITRCIIPVMIKEQTKKLPAIVKQILIVGLSTPAFHSSIAIFLNNCIQEGSLRFWVFIEIAKFAQEIATANPQVSDDLYNWYQKVRIEILGRKAQKS